MNTLASTLRRLAPIGLALGLAFGLASCGGGGGIGGSGSPTMGTLRVSLTDAPACGYDQVNVTVERVRVNQSSTAEDGDGGWSEIVLPTPLKVDLLTLTNGVLKDLGQTELPAGRYTQVRLVLAANSPAAPLANSVVPSGGTETALDTPSGQQSGLKLNNLNLDVPAGKIADLVLDFDACKSVVKRGNSGRYNLKPVLSAFATLADAGLRIEGFVDPAIAATTTTVSAQLDGVVVKATPPDASGRFLIYPVPEGTYDLVITAAGRVNAVMTGVPVTAPAPTQVNPSTLRILPPAATTRSVAGTVTPATATVRALQIIASGPTLDVGFWPVDADSGAFGGVLPIEAPVRGSYVPNPTALNFAPVAAAAGLYTLEATSAGAIKTQPINVANPVPDVTLTFP